ncbi:MAG: sugar ABC transporter permease [Treponemataceae bacterium]
MVRSKRRSYKRGGGIFTLPVALFLLTFIVYPFLFNVRLAFTDGGGDFAGLVNFTKIAADKSLGNSFGLTVYYVVGSVFFQMLLGTAVGIALESPFKGRGIVRSLILIPWVLPGAVAATTWAWMYHGDFGIITRFLSFGLSGERYGLLTRPWTVMPALIAVNVWKMFPFVAVMVTAGLQSIDKTLYEAARVDGAGRMAEIRYITLPGIRHVLFSVLLLLTIWGFNSITLIFIMTQGGPADVSLILPLHVYRMGFMFFNFNTAAAESIFLFAILAVLIAVYLRVFTQGEGGDE